MLSSPVGFRLMVVFGKISRFSPAEESKMTGLRYSCKRFKANPYSMTDHVFTLRARWQRADYATLPASSLSGEHRLIGGESAAPSVSPCTMIGTA
jgi:hypothetical protein